jgi:hypothetical protein
MAGGLMQLVAYGAQDIFLTGTRDHLLEGLLPQTHQLCWNPSSRPSLVRLISADA